MKISLIIAAAGKGVRAGFDKNKLLVSVGGRSVISRTIAAFSDSGLIDETIVACAFSDAEEIKKLLPANGRIVYGGSTRTQSVKNALAEVTGDIVLIHDGARPFVNDKIIKDCIEGAAKFGGAVTAFPSRDTVCSADGGKITGYLGKQGLYSVQTPQAFKTELIRKAYTLSEGQDFNDDGEVYKNFIGEPHVVMGDARNIKLTFAQDFEREDTRFGTGFDCHKLVEGRKLILGGVEIAHDKGLLGHSDADVLTHAVMDALLSAAAMRDIGYHFPDTDPKYKGADSIELLKKVLAIIGEKGFKPSNVSATIMAEKPKLLKHIPAITQNLARALNLPAERIGIGATTLEGLGFVGREEGICVHATAVITR